MAFRFSAGQRTAFGKRFTAPIRGYSHSSSPTHLMLICAKSGTSDGDRMQKAALPLLIAVIDGIYLILRFLRRKAFLNLIVGLGVLTAPFLILIAKRIAVAALPAYAKAALAILATAAFAAFSYHAALSIEVVKSQWNEGSGRLKPGAVEMAAYAIGVIATIAFAAAVCL